MVKVLVGYWGLADNLNLTLSESAYFSLAFFIVILAMSVVKRLRELLSYLLSSHLNSKDGGKIVFVSELKYFRLTDEVTSVSKLPDSLIKIPPLIREPIGSCSLTISVIFKFI